MATDSQRIVQLPVRGQPNVTPTSSSKPTEPYTLETIYTEALSEVETLHTSGRLPEVYYDILTTTKTPMDLLYIVDEANERRMGKQSQSKHALYSTVSSTVKRLDRYAGAIDMLAQSSPQAFGLNVVGLIWGSLKVLLVVAQDVIDTFGMVVQTLKDVESSLPITETLTQIYGSSEIQLLRQPLIDIYKAMISLGLGVVKLCDQGSLQSLGRSTWTSLQGQFKTSVAELARAAQLVQRAAQVEHMCATQKVREIVDIESRRQKSFRREILRNSRQPVERGPLNPVVPSNTAPLGFLAPQFTGRDTELAQLKMMLSRRSDALPARCSIVGMPGLGKTQLALKYASQIFDPLTGPMILWTSAATTEKLTVGYSEVLNLVDHVDRDHDDQGVRLRTARRWLESAPQKPWLLVFDNVNEDTVPFLREYLPQTNENLAMLFTMRSNDVAQTLLNPTSSAEAQAILHVDVPNPDDARDLLLAVLEAPNEVDAASQIAKAETLAKSVGYLPLAINQVATFAKQHSKNLDYILGVYQDEQAMDIMKWDNRLSAYEQRSVMAAFSSSLDDLAKASPVASLLLQTLSFFDPESIPLDMIVSGAYPIRDLRSYSEQRRPKPSEPPIAEEGLSDLTPGRRVMHKIQQKILRRSKKVTKKPTENLQHTILPVNLQDRDRDDLWALKVSKLLEDSIDFPKAVRQLRLLAFVAHKSDACGETIRIHDLVRSMIRYNARQSVFDPLSYRMAAAIVDYAFHILESPWLSQASWPSYEKILPHYRSIVSFQEARDGCNIEVVRASIKVTDYLSTRGRNSEAVQTIEAVMPIQQKWLGGMDVDYVATLNQLAGFHSLQMNYDQAESLVEQVSKARVATLGATHLDTLDSMEELAHIYANQQRYDEASSLQELVLSGKKKRIGADHGETLWSQHLFGQTYEEQGNFVKAELMYEDTLRSMEKTLGTSDHSTLRVLCALGTLKHKLQRFDEADVLLTRVLAVDLTSELPWSKWVAEQSLGKLRRDQGRLAEAEVLLKASLADTEKLYGTEHVITAGALVKLALVYVDMRRFADAEPLLRRALNITDSSGELGGITHTSHYFAVNLAFVIEQQNRVAEAEGVYREVWDEVSEEPGIDLVTIIICAASLSRTLYAQERTQEAEPLHERALNSLERALIWLYRRGIYDTNGDWYGLVTIGRVLEDEEMCKIALKVQEEKIGFAHPVTQRTLQALVAILHGKGKAEEERGLVQRCKEAGLELRLPEDAEAPGLGGGDSGAESAGQGVPTVQADEHASGGAAHSLHAGEEIAAGS